MNTYILVLCYVTFCTLYEGLTALLIKIQVLRFVTPSRLKFNGDSENRAAYLFRVYQFVVFNVMSKYFLPKSIFRGLLGMYIPCVPLATEPGISLIILPLMRILQRNLKRYRHIPFHFSHNDRTPVQISLQYLHWC